MLETYTYKCELTTEADAFMEWFHKTLSECVTAANAGTITRDDGWGTARGRVPVDLSLDGNEYAWTLENVYPPDWSAQRLDEMLKIERLYDSYSAPHIGYRAKRLPVTPARLEVDLYWAGAELGDVWGCLLAKLARLTVAAPAGTVDQGQRDRGGNPGRKAHRDAIERLRNGEDRNVNYQTWIGDYAKETGTHPDTMGSGGAELYKKRVWQPFQKQAK